LRDALAGFRFPLFRFPLFPLHWMFDVRCSMFDVFHSIMKGLFITFEGTEGSGKSTQILPLADRLRSLGRIVRTLREPGGTPIGEEVRHTLKHSKDNAAMTAEAELLLMNASRAQLVREVIRPALAAGEIVLCDRFYDSTVAYQGYGRQLDLKIVKAVIDVAVGDTRPDRTLLLEVPPDVSAERLRTVDDAVRARPAGGSRPEFLRARRPRLPRHRRSRTEARAGRRREQESRSGHRDDLEAGAAAVAEEGRMKNAE
jgi:dTMP kinase